MLVWPIIQKVPLPIGMIGLTDWNLRASLSTFHYTGVQEQKWKEKVMNVEQNQNKRLKIIGAVLVALILIMLPAGSVSAQKPSTHQQEGEEEAMLSPESKTKATITEKTLETVTTNIGDRFALSDETIITNPDGQQVSIRKMRVPCDAEISFEIIKGKRTAQRINVVSIENGASWQWTSKQPD